MKTPKNAMLFGSSRIVTRVVSLCLAFFSIGCSSSSKRVDSLDGEWILELSASQGGGHPTGEASGRLVFSEKLPVYGEDPPLPRAPYAIGRSYIDMTPLAGARSSSRTGVAYFDPSPDADVFDEVYASFDSTDTLIVEIAPRVTDYEPVLKGRLFPDSVVGTWSIIRGEAPELHGAFRMKRTGRTAATDSARVRAVRAAERARRG